MNALISQSTEIDKKSGKRAFVNKKSLIVLLQSRIYLRSRTYLKSLIHL